jgi:2-polyprenyl-3-methyl-5-hydroxy-6-metoxy-1,4-benzoquinol methylase
LTIGLELNRGATGYSRGFFSAEMIRKGDRILDIGCGDGFFSRRFFNEKCSAIDAIDIEPSAIATAKEYNYSPKINYSLQDITKGDLPRNDYDVVVWDGAIGHFSADATKIMLDKIKRSMKPDGVFTGSESIGFADYDHLQQFYSLEDFHNLFKNHFRYVHLKSITYRTGIFHIGGERTEGYWRCSDSIDRLNENNWKQF